MQIIIQSLSRCCNLRIGSFSDALQSGQPKISYRRYMKSYQWIERIFNDLFHINNYYSYMMIYHNFLEGLLLSSLYDCFITGSLFFLSLCLTGDAVNLALLSIVLTSGINSSDGKASNSFLEDFKSKDPFKVL